MAIHVTSEIGTLKTVLLHRPGQELEHLTPDYLERLLFDDIPYLRVAQREHDAFAQVLRDNGARVLYLEDLMAETLREKPQLRDPFIRESIDGAGSIARNYRPELYRLLMSIEDERELVLKTMAGVSAREVGMAQSSPLSDLIHRGDRFVLEPIPNLYFTRDPFATIGSGVSLNRMYSRTRQRETIYGRYILEHHPDFARQVTFYYRPDLPFNIEGGDVLNLSESVIMVGISQRTTPEAIELLASALFADPTCPVRTVLAMDIPSMRAFMHLDTVCTQLDRNKFTIHPGILETLRVYELTPGSGGIQARQLDGALEQILCRYLGVDQVTLIHCGGKDRIASEREQWNDGSNTLCIAPGKVVVYDRNHITNCILRDNGVTVLEVPSSELSRGRGGPRCMSMPFERLSL